MFVAIGRALAGQQGTPAPKGHRSPSPKGRNCMVASERELETAKRLGPKQVAWERER